MTLGEKLKDVRTAKGLSLEVLAKKTNLTRSFLSQVEKNKTSPSIASLVRIAAALQVHVADLFLYEVQEDKYVIRPGERESFVIEKEKIRIEILAPRKKEKKFEPMIIHFGVGGETDAIAVGGVLFCLVLQGRVELNSGGEVQVLTKGDSIYLDSRRENRWRNIGTTEVIAFAVATKPII
jgi:transcriptional regulator with XRE-family HTH domain